MTVDFVGQTFTNSKGREYKVMALDPERKSGQKVYHIKFTESGYETTAKRPDVRSGLIRDRLEPTTYGVASLGFAHTKGNELAYKRWHGMIRRCYDTAYDHYHNYGGAGITVCERWLRFDYFLEDLEKIEGYEKEGFESGALHLDKDIKQQHLQKCQRIYSRETCMFVSKKDNDQFRVNNEHLKHEFKAMSPDGTVFVATGIKAFAREHGLNGSAVAQCLKGNAKQHKGWTFAAV
jgi:hypothetical protein